MKTGRIFDARDVEDLLGSVLDRALGQGQGKIS